MTKIFVTANFEQNLDEIRLFFMENAIEWHFDILLQKIEDSVVATLVTFPEAGRDFFARYPLSQSGQHQAKILHKKIGNKNLREYIFDDYIVLYALRQNHIYLLSIKHHRQLAFDFEGVWL